MIFILLSHIAAILTPGELNIPRTTPDSVLPTVLRIVFAVAGAISVLVVTIAGLRLVTSVGDPQAVTRTRNTIVYALLGLVICIAGFTIVSFVLNKTL